MRRKRKPSSSKLKKDTAKKSRPHTTSTSNKSDVTSVSTVHDPPSDPPPRPSTSAVVTDKCTAVLFTEKQTRAAVKHIKVLQERQVRAKEMKCDTLEIIENITVADYNEFHILVDRQMIDLLMGGSTLHSAVSDKFQEIESAGKHIYALNELDSDFDGLFIKLPSAVRKKWTNPSKGVTSTSKTGVSGGVVSNANVIGEIAGSDNPVLAVHFPGPRAEETCGPRMVPDKTKVEENNILHIQSYLGALAVVDFILSQKLIDIESRGEKGRTPVMMAAQTGMVEVVKFLKQKGCKMDVKDSDGNNILHVACLGGYVDMVKYILSEDIAQIESKGEFGRSPVMMAAERGHSSVVDLLLTKRCNLSETDATGNNILHVACIGGSQVMVGYILSQKITAIESRGRFGRTPVMHATAMSHKAVVDLLISKGCDLSAVDEDKNNTLHLACIAGDLEIVKSILPKFDIDCKGKYSWTPVMMAAENGHKDVFDYLVERECNLEYEDDSGSNVLHAACISGNIDIIETLRKRHDTADFMKENRKGISPLTTAIISKRDNIVNYYFKCGSVPREG